MKDKKFMIEVSTAFVFVFVLLYFFSHSLYFCGVRINKESDLNSLRKALDKPQIPQVILDRKDDKWIEDEIKYLVQEYEAKHFKLEKGD